MVGNETEILLSLAIRQFGIVIGSPWSMHI